MGPFSTRILALAGTVLDEDYHAVQGELAECTEIGGDSFSIRSSDQGGTSTGDFVEVFVYKGLRPEPSGGLVSDR